MKVLHRIENPLNHRGTTPLYLEMQSHPRITPYMVTASSVPWMWIASNRSGRIRAAFRYREKDTCEQGLFHCILSQADNADWKWENIFSVYNLKKAQEYLADKGYPNVDLWVGKDVQHPEVELTVHSFDWETPFWFLLPSDRRLFGWISEEEDQYVGLVFDPLNTMCILHPKFVQMGR